MANKMSAQAEKDEAPNIEMIRTLAAAAAVAVALAIDSNDVIHQPTQNSWQSVMRANRLSQHASMYFRKQKGALR